MSATDNILRWFDRGVVIGLGLLIVATPLAIGSVNSSALVAMELGVFALVAGWMMRLLIGGTMPPADSKVVRVARQLLLPFAAMLWLLILQLTPMPPPVLHMLSPATYRVYRVAFPGWPSPRPRQRVLPVPQPAPESRITTAVSVSPADQERASAPAAVAAAAAPVFCNGCRWRPLTLSPSVTGACLIELAALGSVFFLVLLYPFGFTGEPRAQVRFIRILIYFIVTTATLVALIGIAERAWWNGKILWLYLPTDWPGPLLVGSPRASGPFVDPDHFANYLALVLPLAVAGALFPFSLIRRDQRPNKRLLSAGGAVLMLSAVVLSLSRGGGVAAGVGIISALAIAFRWAPDRAPGFLRRLGSRAVPLSLVTFALMMGLIVYVIGAPARSEVGKRIAGTGASDISARVTAWRETLAMAADFPLLGVGAGAWPEIFPHYHAPPQSPYYFFRTAEDDYLQFAAENGIAGIVALLVFAGLLIRAVALGAHRMPSHRRPLLAGLAGGLMGGLVQEFADCSLHIPANALLFAILLGLTLRVAISDAAGDEPGSFRMARKALDSSAIPLLPAAAAVILMAAAWKQDGRAYPFGIDQSQDLAAAEENLGRHPAMAAAHLTAARMMPDSGLQRGHLSAAVWLEPNNALARDLYARNLLLAGEKAEALGQISLSVYRGPFVSLHYYLAPGAIPWLLPEEQQAISRGFDRAIDSEFTSAAGQAASFYEQLGRYRDSGAAYARAARLTADDIGRFDFLFKAARDYLQTREYAAAEQALLLACQIRPDDPGPYAELAQNVYAPKDNLAAARAIIKQGIKHGADPYALQMALAGAAEQNGDYSLTEAALVSALRYELSFDTMLRLGQVYFEEQRFERSVSTLQQAAKLNPNSPEAFMWLARAHEANYDYYAADRSWRQTLVLAPADPGLRDQYRDFRQRIAGGEKHAGDQ
jgi:tetratricopeptide (TPR) repeat protein